MLHHCVERCRDLAVPATLPTFYLSEDVTMKTVASTILSQAPLRGLPFELFVFHWELAAELVQNAPKISDVRRVAFLELVDFDLDDPMKRES